MFGSKEWQTLVKRAVEVEAPCLERPELWSPPEDENGVTTLPKPWVARMMCAPCPLLGKECEVYAATTTGHVGVLNGKVRDDWGTIEPFEDLPDELETVKEDDE